MPSLEELRETEDLSIIGDQLLNITANSAAHVANCPLCQREGFTAEYNMLSLARMLRLFDESLAQRNRLDSIE